MRFLKEHEIEQKNTFIASMLALKKDSLMSLVEDYSYWNEMASFVGNIDKDWARVNIAPALETFHLCRIEVFSTAFEKLYEAHSAESKESCSIALNKGQMASLFARDRIAFFICLIQALYLRFVALLLTITMTLSVGCPADIFLWCAT